MSWRTLPGRLPARLISLALIAAQLVFCPDAATAQEFSFLTETRQVATASPQSIARLADEIAATSRDDGSLTFRRNQWRLQLAAGRYADAATSLAAFRTQALAAGLDQEADQTIPYAVFARAKTLEMNNHLPFDAAYRQMFRELVGQLDNQTACRVTYWFPADVDTQRLTVDRAISALAGKEKLKPDEALDLIGRYVQFEVYRAAAPFSGPLIVEDDNARYIIERGALIKTPDGATLSAIVVRPKKATTPLPAAFEFTIYADLGRDLGDPKFAASRGYAGVLVHARGKGLSPDKIDPYEHEVDDTRAAIDWISKQPWSNGAVGMYGGSYNGYAAWAATKKLHPALRAIVPYAAAIPGFGLPMENNVFNNANYGWAFYVSNNKYLDQITYNQPERWRSLNTNWYLSGRPYRDIDKIDGTLNPLLQRWLNHPSFDSYWQAKIPFGDDFAKIDIPVLTITGYYDDGQLSAMWYLREHYRHNPSAQHYLLIGPYDHFGTQGSIKPSLLRGYQVDPVAQFDTPEITFQFLDYVMRGGPKPTMLKDKINYEVMGANTWKHARSLQAMSSANLRLYLSSVKDGGRYRLAEAKPAAQRFIEQTVDLADRTTSNNDYYPFPIVRDALQPATGLVFVSDPLTAPLEISGSFSGELKISINKKDVDLGVSLYELSPDGKVMQLSYYLGRASYANDMTTRKLLAPGEKRSVPLGATRMTSRQLLAGSRLLVVADVNKNSFHQVNHGTGGDVSAESVKDAGEPLRVRWYADSYIDLPVWK